jgi:signal transduction histidine kinase
LRGGAGTGLGLPLTRALVGNGLRSGAAPAGETDLATDRPKTVSRVEDAGGRTQLRGGAGTGLGLPLTRALVEANRGVLRLTSQKGEVSRSRRDAETGFARAPRRPVRRISQPIVRKPYHGSRTRADGNRRPVIRFSDDRLRDPSHRPARRPSEARFRIATRS